MGEKWSGLWMRLMELPGPPGATQRVFCTALGVLTSFVPCKWLKPEKPRDAEALLGTCSGKPEPRSAAEAAECAKGLLGHSWGALGGCFSHHFGIVLGPLGGGFWTSGGHFGTF